MSQILDKDELYFLDTFKRTLLTTHQFTISTGTLLYRPSSFHVQQNGWSKSGIKIQSKILCIIKTPPPNFVKKMISFQ